MHFFDFIPKNVYICKMEKIKLDKKKLNQIKNLYLNNKLSLRKISILTNCSTSLISRILQDKGIYNYKKNTISKQKILNSSNKNKLIVICKKTGKQFNDYTNKSGVLTNHIKEIYPNFKIPTSFKRRQHKYKTGNYWFEEFFYIKEIKKENIKTKKCVYCNWKTKDIKNKSGAYTVHLEKVHNISIEEHLKNFPDDKGCFNNYKKRLKKQEKFKKEDVDYVCCMICNEKFKKLTDTHLKKHNISMSDYKIKFPNYKTSSKKSISIQRKIYNKKLKYIGNNFISKAQKEINDLINNLGIETILNDKKFLKGTEIDILIPNKNIGIEYNGCLYHSEVFGKKLRQFHKNKTELMNNNSYGLIHIFEDEWEFKKDVVKSKIKHIINANFGIKKIHARKCVIKEIDNSLKNEFLNNNHIQGKDRSNVNLGAFFEESLVSVITFDNIRQMNIKNNNKKIYELKRFCVNINYSVPGVADKLLKHFIKKYNPKKIISFADRRWTINKDNNLYIKLGFKLTNILGPDYSYYNPKIHRHKRLHKFAFGKNSLKKKYPKIYDENKTEWQMMQELGFDRIWDCGKFKYELDF